MFPTTPLRLLLAQRTIFITKQGWLTQRIFGDVVADVADLVSRRAFWKVSVRQGEEHKAVPRSAISGIIFAFERFADIVGGIIQALRLQLEAGSKLLYQALHGPTRDAVDFTTLAPLVDAVSNGGKGRKDNASNQGEH